jgi:hypothetical protein
MRWKRPLEHLKTSRRRLYFSPAPAADFIMVRRSMSLAARMQ